MVEDGLDNSLYGFSVLFIIEIKFDMYILSVAMKIENGPKTNTKILRFLKNRLKTNTKNLR